MNQQSEVGFRREQFEQLYRALQPELKVLESHFNQSTKIESTDAMQRLQLFASELGAIRKRYRLALVN